MNYEINLKSGATERGFTIKRLTTDFDLYPS